VGGSSALEAKRHQGISFTGSQPLSSPGSNEKRSGASIVEGYAMADFPYFPFYPSDWISSPRNMCSTLVQQGGYIRLLCACWLSGDCSLPDDNRKLSTLSGLPEQELDVVREFFIAHPRKEGALTNERLLKEWDKAHWISEMRSKAGKKSGKSRRTHVQHMPEQNTNKTRTAVHKSESDSESSSDLEVRSQKLESEARIQKNQKKNSDCKTPPALATGSMTWNTYSEEYQRRYGVLPIRNAKVNSCLKSFMSRVPEKEAPDIASFYVRHPGAYYVSRGHPVEILLRDAEKLRTEWASNKTITQKQAQQSDGRAARGQMWQEVIQELDAEKRGKA